VPSGPPSNRVPSQGSGSGQRAALFAIRAASETTDRVEHRGRNRHLLRNLALEIALGPPRCTPIQAVHISPPNGAWPTPSELPAPGSGRMIGRLKAS
jgi:hypothetical protein